MLNLSNDLVQFSVGWICWQGKMGVGRRNSFRFETCHVHGKTWTTAAFI